MPAQSLDQIVSLCKRRGFVFPGSDIYGGLANTWDYGPLGVELKNKIKALWWQTFIRGRRDMVGLDASILMNPRVWEASGHVGSFSDELIECKKCNSRLRTDKLIEEKSGLVFFEIYSLILTSVTILSTCKQTDPFYQFVKYNEKNEEELTLEFLRLVETLKVDINIFKNSVFLIAQEMKTEHHSKKMVYQKIIELLFLQLKITCPKCQSFSWSTSEMFNLLFKTHQGVIEDKSAAIYLRPETAQGIFVNFKNIVDTSRMRLPFGVGQIGKAFRNEITPGNFTFRTREFEQMEIEYFFDPEKNPWEEIFAEWKKLSMSFLVDTLGISSKNLRFRDHEKDELSHYSKGTTDIEYKFPWGWGELCAAAAYRTDFDLKQHEKFSGQELMYTDPDDPKRKITPHVMEPSFGSDRITLAVLLDAYTEETLAEDDMRTVMKFTKKIAPNDLAILPLSKKDHLSKYAEDLYNKIVQETDLTVDFDVTGSIGKRYRRQDEIGTPKCITVDFGTIGEDTAQGEKDTVTIRDRDTQKQERMPIADLMKRLLTEK